MSTPVQQSDPLAKVGRQLIAAAERRLARRRRRARATGAGVALAAVAALVLAGVALLGGGSGSGGGGAGRDGAELTVSRGLDRAWTFAVYPTARASLCVTRAPRGGTAGVTCESASLAATELHDQAAAALDATGAGPGRAFVSGLVDADATAISVQPAGAPARATPVPTRTLALPASGGAALRARPFAAAVVLPAGSRTLRVTVRDAHGGVHSLRLAVDGDQRAPLGPGGGERLLFSYDSGASLDVPGAAALAQARLELAGLGRSLVSASASRLTVDLPGATPADAAEAGAALSGAPLAFFDWEANVIGADGRPVVEELRSSSPADVRDATAISQDGGVASEGLSAYRAVRRAADQPPRAAGTRSGPAYYLFDRHHRLLAGPVATAAAATRALGATAAPAGSELLRVPQGTVVVQSLTGGDRVRPGDRAARFYVLRDTVALSGSAIVDPRATRTGSGVSEVRFGLTPAGQARFHALTRTLAQRGAALIRPTGGTRPEYALQHFAVVLDGRLLSIASIDPLALPDGITGRNGASIEGGFTPTSASDLARLLSLGGLPGLTRRSSVYVRP